MLWLLLLFWSSHHHQHLHIIVMNYCTFSSPAWSFWSSPGSWQFWYRLHICLAFRSRPPSWQSLQPRIVHCPPEQRGLHCHLGRSLFHLLGLQHKTCYLREMAHGYLSSSENWLNQCMSAGWPQGVARTSAYLLKSVCRQFLWGQSLTPVWKKCSTVLVNSEEKSKSESPV